MPTHAVAYPWSRSIAGTVSCFSAIRGGAIHKNVPILVLTTESAPHLKARARDAGATGWIVKPFDDEAIVSVVRRVTGARA